MRSLSWICLRPGAVALESDFSWSLAVGAIYRLNDTIAIEAQYKSLFVDYDEGYRGAPGFFAYDTVSHGPLLGVSFQF